MKTTDMKTAEIKKVAVDFFRYWWNSPGNNTDQGFDHWWGENKNKYISQQEPLSREKVIEIINKIGQRDDDDENGDMVIYKKEDAIDDINYLYSELSGEKEEKSCSNCEHEDERPNSNNGYCFNCFEYSNWKPLVEQSQPEHTEDYVIYDKEHAEKLVKPTDEEIRDGLIK